MAEDRQKDALVCPTCVNRPELTVQTVCWDGTDSDFWNAVMKTRSNTDIESDAGVLSEVLLFAKLALAIKNPGQET